MPQGEFVPVKLGPPSPDQKKRWGKHSERLSNFVFSLRPSAQGDWVWELEQSVRRNLPNPPPFTFSASANEVLITCPEDDIEAHFATVKEAVAAVNERMREKHNAAVEQKKTEAERKKIEEQEKAKKIEDTLGRLDFS